MDITNKALIYWSCRRGMRELDLIILPFFKYDFDCLDNQNKRRFIRLLECEDPDLFSWIMNHNKPEDKELQKIILIIQTRNKVRNPLVKGYPVSLCT